MKPDFPHQRAPSALLIDKAHYLRYPSWRSIGHSPADNVHKKELFISFVRGDLSASKRTDRKQTYCESVFRSKLK